MRDTVCLMTSLNRTAYPEVQHPDQQQFHALLGHSRLSLHSHHRLVSSTTGITFPSSPPFTACLMDSLGLGLQLTNTSTIQRNKMTTIQRNEMTIYCKFFSVFRSDKEKLLLIAWDQRHQQKY